MKTRQTGHVEDYVDFEESRTLDKIQHWGNWVRTSAETMARYEGNIEGAPRYTHSCSRYFRPCAMIPFCDDTPEGREIQLIEMTDAEPSPSEQKVLEGIEQ
jgi:hypothetical protein